MSGGLPNLIPPMGVFEENILMMTPNGPMLVRHTVRRPVYRLFVFEG